LATVSTDFGSLPPSRRLAITAAVNRPQRSRSQSSAGSDTSLTYSAEFNPVGELPVTSSQQLVVAVEKVRDPPALPLERIGV
jgi:hypothetical protein